MTEQIKPCPFCGGEAKCIEFYGLYHVICCNCHIAGKDCSTRESAVSAWNSRPIENELEAENARLRDALDTIVGLFEINGGFWAVAEKMHETAKKALEKGKEE